MVHRKAEFTLFCGFCNTEFSLLSYLLNTDYSLTNLRSPAPVTLHSMCSHMSHHDSKRLKEMKTCVQPQINALYYTSIVNGFLDLDVIHQYFYNQAIY